MTRFTYHGMKDLAEALVQIAGVVGAVEFVASDRRAGHVSRFEILGRAVAAQKAQVEPGSFADQLLDFMIAANGALPNKPKLSIVRADQAQK